MIEIIISYFKAIAEGTTLFTKVYGLCDLVNTNTETYPAEYNNGNYNPVEFSEDKSLIYFRKNGPVQWEDLDSVIGGKTQKKMILPLRIVAKARKEDFGNDQFSNDVMALALIRRMNFNNPYDLKQATLASYIESVSIHYETNRDEIIKEELGGNSENADFEFIYVALDFHVIVTGNPECFYNTCGDPASNCWEVPICRQIPTEKEVQQIRDDLAAEIAARISENTTLSGGLDAEIATRADADTTLQSNIDTKENIITAGTTSQYWRGDKTWQTLDKSTVGLSNVPNTDATNPSNIVQDSTHRFVSDTEKSTWNAKQNALGFTPENSANKETVSLDTSTTKYPNSNIVKTYVDSGLSGKENAFSKNTAFNKNFGSAIGDIPEIGVNFGAMETVETDAGGRLVSAPKSSGYNKPFGSTSNSVCQGNDSRLSDSRNGKLFAVGYSTIAAPIDTTEDQMVSILIPSGTLDPTSEIVFTCTWSRGAGGNVTLRARLHTGAGNTGTLLGQFITTTAALSGQTFFRIINKGSPSVQEAVGQEAQFNQSAVTVQTAAINTSNDCYLNITVQKAIGANTFNINNFNVKINKA